MNAHFRIGRKYNFNKAVTPFVYDNDESEFTYIGFQKNSGLRNAGTYVFKGKDGHPQFVSKLNSKLPKMLLNKVEVK